MRHIHNNDAERAAENVRRRVSRHAKEGHAIVCMSRADMIRHFEETWPRDHVCTSCRNVRMVWKDHQDYQIKHGDREAVDYMIIPNVDKIDPAKGYIAGNMRIICGDCNGGTSDATSVDRLARRALGIYTKADALGIGEAVKDRILKLLEEQG